MATNQKTYKIKVNTWIDSDMIENLIVTAIEGGSNYWYYIGKDGCDLINNNSSEGEPLSIRLHQAIQIGISVPIRDIEEEDEILGEISFTSIETALQLMSEQYPDHFVNVINDNADAETADVFFQLAVMKDVVYG